MDEKETRKMKLRGESSEYDAIKTKKSRIFNYDSEESDFCPEEFDKELEKLEGDHYVLDKIFKSIVNKMKIISVSNSYQEFADHNHSLSQVIESQGGTSFSSMGSCKVLTCQHAEYKLDDHFYVIVTGILAKYYYEEQDLVSVFGFFDRSNHSLVIRPLKTIPESFFDLRFLVISPNMKVKVTGLTAKSDCMRANLLSSLFAPSYDFGVPGLKGTIQHAIFERVMLATEPLTEHQQKIVVFEELKEQIEGIYTLEINYDLFERELLAAIENIVNWKAKYLGTNEPIFENARVRIFISHIFLTEKAFSSDVFGLNGIVDAIFGCKLEIIGEYGKVVETESVYIPFELKTGLRIKDEYESQVLIYNYLMREETGEYDQGFGFVFYSNVDNRLDYVKLDHLRFYNLIQQRNNIISKTRELKRSFENILQYQLPARTSEIYSCNFCDLKSACVASATLQKAYNSPQKLCALVSSSSHSLESRDSIKLAFFQENSNSSVKVAPVSTMDTEELDALLEEAEGMFINANKEALIAESKWPDLEDMFTKDEPKFKGFEEIFKELNMARVEYFAKWLDMILIEESHNLRDNPREKADDYAQFATSLDFDSYDELKLYLKDSKAERDLLLKFSHFFQMELEASLFLEKLSRGQSITLKHSKMNITLFCVVKSKTIRKKQIFTNEYYVMSLMVQCKKSHLNDAFRASAGKINYEKITTGWEYYDPVYVFENKMRSNIIRLICEPRQKELSYIIVDKKPPRYGKEVSEKQLMDIIGNFDLNFNQKDCILKSLNTENYNLILGRLP